VEGGEEEALVGFGCRCGHSAAHGGAGEGVRGERLKDSAALRGQRVWAPTFRDRCAVVG
jgi:hypothetical protein